MAAWNAHDLGQILSHYADDFSMASPFIPGIVGEPSGRLQGKEAVGAYWETALGRYPDLRFVLHKVFCGADTVAVLYESVGGRTAIEHFRFDAAGLVCEASGQYDRI
ncbi:MAG: nuclear transport factor 2 family protein [Fibrella sp.]|nr:nuclear transport factor 2 family protein [Armatimonadota bacterium]